MRRDSRYVRETMLPATPYLTIEEAAGYVKRGIEIVAQWVREGKVRTTQPGGRGSILIYVESLREFVDRFEVVHEEKTATRRHLVKSTKSNEFGVEYFRNVARQARAEQRQKPREDGR